MTILQASSAPGNSCSSKYISPSMKRPLLNGRPGLLCHLSVLGVLLLGASFGQAQTLPPGQLPPGPPPQPGQLGPAPEKSASPAETAKPVEPAAASNEPISKDPNTIRTTIRYVLVPTTVLDPDGHGYVNGLTQKNFELLDNDRPQKIVSEFTQQPLSVVLAVQANSEIEPVLPILKKSGVLLQGLVTGQDSDVAVLSFDHRIQHLQDFTTDPEKIDDAMQKLRAGSSSARLIDSVLEADQMLLQHDRANKRRHVVVLLSRNLDKGSESHLRETVRRMQFDNVIIYCIDISKIRTAFFKQPDYPRPANGGTPPEALPNIAGGQPRSETSNVQQSMGNVLNGVPPIYHGIRDLFKKTPAEAFSYFTGGRMYFFARERAMEDAISDIGADLNSQYLLSYTPNNTSEPGFHTIKVSVNRPGLQIRTRPGYWWGGGQVQ